MNRCFQLAEMARGKVSPNPLVGCVIVHDGVIIGEGYHREFGGPHAEVNAIREVRDTSLLNNATLYVNLEPCSHYGKTPPCADLIVSRGIPKVVIANTDPNPDVNGSGIRRLREHGIEVITGIEAAQGERLNRTFFKAMRQQLPYVTLKWAQSADGFMSRLNGSDLPKKISNAYSDRLVHKLRSENDGILIGTATAIADNPLLTNRLWTGKSPVRIVLGSPIELNNYRLGMDPPETLQMQPEDHNNLKPVLHQLADRGIHALLAEGGSRVLTSFIQQGLWDEIMVIRSKEKWAGGIEAPALSMEPYRRETIGSDTWYFYKNKS